MAAGIALAIIGSWFAPPRRSEFETPGLEFILGGFCCGTVLGGILGFVLSQRALAEGWIEGAQRSKAVWIGCASGLAVAVVILSPGWIKGVPYRWWAAVPIASALVMLGGIVAESRRLFGP